MELWLTEEKGSFRAVSWDERTQNGDQEHTGKQSRQRVKPKGTHRSQTRQQGVVLPEPRVTANPKVREMQQTRVDKQTAWQTQPWEPTYFDFETQEEATPKFPDRRH